MKKTPLQKAPRKLVLQSQTLRVLADIDLAQAVGGLDSGNVQCPAVADTGRVDCPGMPTR
ncbi:MAG: hypothetical protein E6J90_22800 [Deltaproteobacteria bacterium]|nr:MAG: hypothetical protein E6J91_35845 [Deltaproteobacteria bacterium]TMQ17059.1 MAG: hypothetical protein E6J90_22800 [Deltaproteobacteria bacterium]